jgi:hypothetical protein
VKICGRKPNKINKTPLKAFPLANAEKINVRRCSATLGSPRAKKNDLLASLL